MTLLDILAYREQTGCNLISTVNDMANLVDQTGIHEYCAQVHEAIKLGYSGQSPTIQLGFLLYKDK